MRQTGPKPSRALVATNAAKDTNMIVTMVMVAVTFAGAGFILLGLRSR